MENANREFEKGKSKDTFVLKQSVLKNGAMILINDMIESDHIIR